MSSVVINKDLKEELSFIDEKAQVYCRDLEYGYQLFFIVDMKEVARIFIKKIKLSGD